MERIQERKFSMYKTLAEVFQNTPASIIDKMPQMDQSINRLNQFIVDINNMTQTQVENRKGIFNSKHEARKKLNDSTYIIAGQIKAYAINTQNYQLAGEVTFAQSRIATFPDGILLINATAVYTKANQYVAQLENYGITPEVIAEYLELIKKFSNLMAQPRIGIVDRKVATAKLKELFKNTDYLLENTMDNLVVIVKNTEKNFYNTYHNSRRIIDPGTYPLALRIKVINTLGQPIELATTKVNATTAIHKTSPFGRCQYKTLPPGNHKLTVEKAGYHTRTIPIAITKGERTDVHIILTPLDTE